MSAKPTNKLDQLIEHLLVRDMRLINTACDEGLPIQDRAIADIREDELSDIIGLAMDLRDGNTTANDLETVFPPATAMN